MGCKSHKEKEKEKVQDKAKEKETSIAQALLAASSPCIVEVCEEELKTAPKTSQNSDQSDFQEFMGKVGLMYDRKLYDPWSCIEQNLLPAVLSRKNRDSEVEELKQFQLKEGQYFPQSLRALLEKWPEILDRARSSRKSNNGQGKDHQF